jgi:ubiquinone/menaquinone biosynthesis C-methylase UbiE
MTTDNAFDAKAKTWDNDPVKVARAAAVAKAIRENVPLTTQMSALEFGCGTGLLSFELKPYLGRITLGDNSPGMLAALQEKLDAAKIANMHPVMMDLDKDAIPPASFDLIFTAMTLHHIDDTEKVLRDMYAMLTQPGYLCVADLDAEDGSFHGPDFSGHKGFDREDLAGKARQAGFHRVHFTTAFHMSKGTGPGQTAFPIFLMVVAK